MPKLKTRLEVRPVYRKIKISQVSDNFVKMKCKQKSCKRNPNQSSTSGFCSVCEDVSKEATDNEKKKNVHCKQILNKVQIDYNEMVKMHEKLSKGENVDPASTSSLILGGNIQSFPYGSHCELRYACVPFLSKGSH